MPSISLRFCRPPPARSAEMQNTVAVPEICRHHGAGHGKNYSRRSLSFNPMAGGKWQQKCGRDPVITPGLPFGLIRTCWPHGIPESGTDTLPLLVNNRGDVRRTVMAHCSKIRVRTDCPRLSTRQNQLILYEARQVFHRPERFVYRLPAREKKRSRQAGRQAVVSALVALSMTMESPRGYDFSVTEVVQYAGRHCFQR